MPDLATLALFTTACAVLTATPGPDMLLIASRSISQGRAAGVLTYAGIAAGSYLQAFAAAFGLSQLFLLVPTAYDALRFSARPISPGWPGRRCGRRPPSSRPAPTSRR